MRNTIFKYIRILLATIVIGCSMLFVAVSCNKNGTTTKNHIWTFTYLKANENQTSNLKTFIEKNWFVMDHIAVDQKLISNYILYENADNTAADWDMIVAVEYFSREGYSEIASQFEEIRQKHQEVKIKGLGFKDLGKVIRSETVTKNSY